MRPAFEHQHLTSQQTCGRQMCGLISRICEECWRLGAASSKMPAWLPGVLDADHLYLHNRHLQEPP